MRIWPARLRVLGISATLIGAVLGGGLTARGAVPARSAPANSAVNPGQFLGAVSCVGSSFCLGVGPDTETTLDTAPYSEVWDGAGWRTLAVPNRNPHEDGLFGISCTSAKNCVAVGGQGPEDGSELSDAWNGRSWKLLPRPAGTGTSVLNGVDCTGARACIAVGSRPSAALAQIWNGTSWHLTPRPVRPGTLFSQFNAIACAGPSHCLAVGDYAAKKTSGTRALAELWNGRSWTMLRGFPNDFYTLNGVACPSVKVCVAVGGGENGKDLYAVSARWNGTSWTRLTTPSPGATGSQQTLSGISCPSVAYCIAAGSRPDIGTGSGAFAEKWTGGPAWTLLSVPDPPDFDFDGTGSLPKSLASVSCPSRKHCLAVGGTSDIDAISSYSSFAVSWNGTSWRVLRTGKVDVFRSVACAPSASCLMTGAYLAANGATRTLTERWTGGAGGGRLLSPSGPPGVLSSVTCPAASFCMAVMGSSATVWNGERWNSSGVSDTVYRQGVINYLSCVSRDFCMAIGFDDSFFSEFWDGRTWHRARLVQPKRTFTNFAFPQALSCVTPSRCLLVGALDAGNGGPIGTLAEAWNGSTWRVLRSPFQHNPNDAFSAVYCRTATDCRVMGADQPADGYTMTLFTAQWNGQRWTATKLPGKYPSGAWDFSGPSGLSCPTASSCVAVGGHSGPADLTLIRTGRSWRTMTAGGPKGIFDVACASARQCVATGQPGTVTTLAKLWNGRTWKLLKTINP